MKTFIHVNQQRIRSNLKHGLLDPVITVKQGRNNTYCHEVEILGPCKVIYSADGNPLLHCGARVIIETESDWKVVR